MRTDEWFTCDRCNGMMRCKPDSYAWMPQFIRLADGTEYICRECFGNHLDEYLEATLIEFSNSMYHALPHWFQEEWMEHAGYRSYGKEEETGWHPYQNDSRQKVLGLLLPYYRSVVFQLTRKSPFTTMWIIWVKE